MLVRDEFIRIAKDGSRLRCSLAPEAIESMVDDIRRLLFVAKGRTTPSEKTAAKVQQTLLRRQATVQSRLGRSLRQEQVDYTYSYTMLFNGFALRTARKNLETIQSAKGVSRAFVAGSLHPCPPWSRPIRRPCRWRWPPISSPVRA